MARLRHEYLLTFPMKDGVGTTLPLAGAAVREPSVSDIQALAELMLDSYRGAIDYEGESIKEALSEVDSYFTRKDSPPMPHLSTLLLTEGRIVSACLISNWTKRKEPLVGYVMTLAEFKGRGLATYVTAESMRKVNAQRHRGVRAVVTEGNTPSERLLARLGFVRVQSGA